MGLLRGGALIFVCILLILSIFFTGIFSVLNVSLKYDNVKQKIISAIDGVDSDIIDIDSLIYENYYKEYQCDLFKCFEEESTPLFLISKHAKDYWKSKFYLFLFISSLLAGLIFLLMQKKINFLLLTGFLTAVSFIPISILDSIGKVLLKVIFSSADLIEFKGFIDLDSFVMIFLSGANTIFLKGLIIALILIGIGIFLKMLKFGFKIEHLVKFKLGSEGREEAEIKNKQKQKDNIIRKGKKGPQKGQNKIQ